ncbi:MAG: SAM-dependent methyltransferase, partial [Schleiferiaceae bacterium]
MDSAKHWEDRYSLNQTGWDLNGPTPALQAAAEGLPKEAFILIPGCGFGWDGEALWSKGYKNVYLSDWAPSA